MSPLVQQLIVYAVVLGAAGWLVRRYWQGRRGRSESSCDRCGARRAPAPPRGIRSTALRVLR
ncbi:MAG: hypothetical protein AAGF11_50630 [Myxococcota bacterium]